MTADIPPGPARKCGHGIVMIGSRSGRPIVPFAVATSRYRAVNSWDRLTPARKCGHGIVMIGSRSGRPIVPFAVATSRYRAVNSWDRLTHLAYRHS